MNIIIPSPRNFEGLYGHSEKVRKFLDQMEATLSAEINSETIRTIRVSLLIAAPERLSEGAFAEFLRFDWKIGFAAIGINGDFNSYLEGNDQGKISVIHGMLIDAFTRLGKKRKAGIDAQKAIAYIDSTFQQFEG